MIPALFRLFNPDRIEGFDYSKPENAPLARAEEALKNQGFVDWYNGPGQYVISRLEKGLIGKLTSAILAPRDTTEDRNKCLSMLDSIKRDAQFIDYITNSFHEEEKRKGNSDA